jgi:hypothetical protein
MSSQLSRAIKLCGTDQSDPPSRLLRAGPLSAELENGALRYIRFSGIEVLRAIAFLVRDENWGTFTPTISDLRVEEGSDGFAVSYRAVCADAKRRLSYEARITGRSDGALNFDVIAEPETDVLTNRTGFVVLHPIAGVAGQPVRVTQVDGRERSDRFPELIDPMQPFRDIRALTHEVAPGVTATCRMEGDAFEMEDQRNWSDASYKTYVRPLALPWPYTLAKGSRHAQSVRLSVEGRLPAGSRVEEARAVAVELGGETGVRMPVIGIGVPAEEVAHSAAASDLLRRLAPRFLVCHLDLRKGHGESELEAYRRLGEATGAELMIEAVIPGEQDPAAELAPLAAALDRAKLRPAGLALSPAADLRSVLPGSKGPEVPPLERIYAAARAALPGVRLGGGMFCYFTELNRKRPPAGMLDYVTHTTCPIVHAADDRSVMETLEALPSIIASTKAFIGDAAYRVGPSVIGCRDNPYGKATLENPDNGRVCLSRVDPRQRGLFGAAWTFGYLAAFARGGAEAVAMGAPTGPFGFIHRPSGEDLPYFDGINKPAVYPAFHVIAGLARGSGQPLLATGISQPGRVGALAWREGDRSILWLANLTAEPVEVALSGMPAQTSRMVVIDASSFEDATLDPNALDALAEDVPAGRITLDAYAVARIG